jgi:hypothetical protein
MSPSMATARASHPSRPTSDHSIEGPDYAKGVEAPRLDSFEVDLDKGGPTVLDKYPLNNLPILEALRWASRAFWQSCASPSAPEGRTDQCSSSSSNMTDRDLESARHDF